MKLASSWRVAQKSISLPAGGEIDPTQGSRPGYRPRKVAWTEVTGIACPTLANRTTTGMLSRS